MLIELPHPVFGALLYVGVVLSAQISITVHISLWVLYKLKPETLPRAAFLALFVGNVAINALSTYAMRRKYRKYSAKYRAKLIEQQIDAEQRLRKAYIKFDTGESRRSGRN